jgi:hypothetical protein
MAFQIDLSPLERSSQNIAQGLSSVGGSIADILQGNKQREQQEQMKGLMQQAATGDVNAIEQLYAINPEIAQTFEQRLASQQQAGRESEDRLQGEVALATSDVVERMHFAKSPEEMKLIFDGAVDDPRFDIDEEDRQFFTNKEARMALITKVKGKDYADALFGDSDGLGDQPSAVQETEWFNKQTPEVQATHLKVKRGEKPSFDEKLDYEKSKAEIKEDSTIRTARKKTKQQRQQGYIDSGVSSADNLATVNRSLDLLNSVETGGIDNAIIRAKQAFGIESADEAELSYELGKSVLKQLKPTFGAAFTVNEMLELKRMEAGLGKSVAGNRRILKNLAKMIKRSADRGMRAAKSLGDDFAANEIMIALSGNKPAETDPSTDQPPASIARPPTEAGAETQQPASLDDQARQWANANPNDPRAIAILDKLKAANNG